MSALVQALGLAPVPDFDAAGLVKDVDRSLARHSLTAGWRWSEDILVGSGKHFHSTTCASSFVLSAGKVSTRRRPLLVEAHDATPYGAGFSNSRERVRGDPQPSRRRWAQDAGGDPYRPAGGQKPEMAELHRRGWGRRGELRAITLIDIFKENHRSSEKTAHPGPRSVVGAANLAASSRGSRTTFAVSDLVVRARQGG